MNMAKKPVNNKISKKEELAVEKLLTSIDTGKTARVRKNVRSPTAKTKEQREHVINVVRKVLSEYIGPYIIIGYDLDDTPFADFNISNNAMDQKATLALFDEVARPIINPPMSFGEDFE